MLNDPYLFLHELEINIKETKHLTDEVIIEQHQIKEFLPELISIKEEELTSQIICIYLLSRIYGIGFRLSYILCTKFFINPYCKLHLLLNPCFMESFSFLFMQLKKHTVIDYNKKKEKKSHNSILIGENVLKVQINKIEELSNIKSYRGVRHDAKMPVRGQRTRTNRRTARKSLLMINGKRNIRLHNVEVLINMS